MIKKTKMALSVATASLTLAGALVSPQAAALTPAEANAKKTAALESQVNDMATMMQAMQSELSRVKALTDTGTNSAKVQELDQWMASVKSAPIVERTKDNQIIVRGGWMRMNDNRGSSNSAFGALGLADRSGLGDDVLTNEVDKDAWYMGAAFDFNVNNDLFGLMDNTSFMIEFGLDYSELGERETSGLTQAITALDAANTVSGGGVAVPAGNYQKDVTVNMLRVNASPKIKFMHGSKFRPWIVPMGIDFNIISPPSDAVTVLNIGMNFGAGVDYEIWNGIVAGVDGRYHWTPDDVDGVDTDGFTLGGSIGFQF